MFDPGLSIGEEINFSKLHDIFKCGRQKGMRKSNSTNTLVIVTNYTNGIYHDKWIGGVLHYTGMGRTGDQDINYKENRIIRESATNGIDMHLFEVMDPGLYTYCGRVELASEPYPDTQQDIEGNNRTVWMFPIRPVPDNNVKKPDFFVFKDMDDYRANGKSAEEKWAKAHPIIKKRSRRASNGLKGKRIRHKNYGNGIILKYDGTLITVKFKKETKTLNYEFCKENDIIEFDQI